MGLYRDLLLRFSGYTSNSLLFSIFKCYPRAISKPVSMAAFYEKRLLLGKPLGAGLPDWARAPSQSSSSRSV